MFIHAPQAFKPRTLNAEVLVKEGGKVTRGTILAYLDDREERARVNELAARSKYYAGQAKRQAKLFT